MISQFPPGVTHVPCDICRKPVDIREGGDWSERWPVTHRLCENSRASDPWTPPLGQGTMALLWSWIKEGVDVPQRAVEAVLETALADNPEPWRPVNMRHIWDERQMVAARLYLRMVILNDFPTMSLGPRWNQAKAYYNLKSGHNHKIVRPKRRKRRL